MVNVSEKIYHPIRTYIKRFYRNIIDFFKKKKVKQEDVEKINKCPHCDSTNISRIDNHIHCEDCGRVLT